MATRSCFSLTALLLVAFAASSAAAAELTADQVIERYLAASGGYQNLKKIQTMTWTGTYSSGGAPIPFVTFRKRPNYYRWDRDIEGTPLVLAYDGKVAWWINPFSDEKGPAKMPEGDAKNLRGEAIFEDELIDYKAKGNRVELLGFDDVDGQRVYKLKVTTKAGAVERYYLDADTFLKLQHSFVFAANDREFEMFTYYMNYKKVGSVLLPHRIEREFAGQHRLIEIKSIELNKSFDDKIFSCAGR